MTTRKMTCIECPQGCQLTIEADGKRILALTGNKCEKGPVYAQQEMENSLRTLTATVLTKGLDLKMTPVRTSKPIPKEKLLEAIAKIREIRLDHPVKTGEIIMKDLLGLGVDVIATRPARPTH